MTYPTFTPPAGVNVSIGTAISVTPRIRRADFGDGYSQRSGDGLNTMPVKTSVEFATLTRAEAASILSFLESRKGYLPFMWKMPGETSARQWIATSWRKTYSDAINQDVSAEFEETFDP